MDTWNNKADETLVALYAKGENQAFNVLLNRYGYKYLDISRPNKKSQWLTLTEIS